MEENLHHTLLHPLIPSSTTTTNKYDPRCATPTTSDCSDGLNTIAPRFIFVFFVAIVSIFANYQASKGFDIAIVNDLKHTPAGNKFHLDFVANDKCAQVVLSASKAVESILYPSDQTPKKPVTRVMVTLTADNLTRHVAVEQYPCVPRQHYVIRLSAALMEEAEVEKEVMLAVQRGMTHVWLWDGAPKEIIERVVEYVGIEIREFSRYRVWGGLDVHSLMSTFTDSQIVSVGDEACWKKCDSAEIKR